MKTRTLLLLAVGTALMILLAGGVLAVQLSGQERAAAPNGIGDLVTVGDVQVTVLAVEDLGNLLSVSVELGGIDDADGIDSFRLVTGDQRLSPVAAPADGRCATLTLSLQRCRIDFDTASTEGSTRIMVLRRGEDQATWRLS